MKQSEKLKIIAIALVATILFASMFAIVIFKIASLCQL